MIVLLPAEMTPSGVRKFLVIGPGQPRQEMVQCPHDNDKESSNDHPHHTNVRP